MTPSHALSPNWATPRKRLILPLNAQNYKLYSEYPLTRRSRNQIGFSIEVRLWRIRRMFFSPSLSFHRLTFLRRRRKAETAKKTRPDITNFEKVGRPPKQLKSRFNSHKVGAFYKVLQAKPLSLTLYGLRQVWHNIPTITGDRATQECDPSTVVVPYGMGLVSSLMPTL